MAEQRTRSTLPGRTDGAAVECPTCHAKFGGMTVCPWDDTPLVPLPNADPTALAFYGAIGAYPPDPLDIKPPKP